ncbi:D-alanine--D-alanine ligase [Paenibacillus planticolens]|uniref:D-alanine--D-alanine ligase n=1 Tax=Paenibacillus planticolens TaxID=2654976 RepID=A0ABX1ZS11_9BACL|nr:D-alanine--D-alanine ligase [Paenibacillus planticolens]NOV02837.1 D-alanine--D-alanine ligase [Paenibacillus planticolens]
MSGKIRVGLIYGGKSGEHDVSLQTAMAVMKAVDFTKYEVVPFYISKKGEWKSGAPLLAPIASKEVLTFNSVDSAHAPVSNALAPIFGAVQPKGDVTLASAAAAGTKDGIDVIFPLLHGTFGEDGTIQGLLEMANVPYVGAGVLASAVGMDKVMMKKIFAQEGLPQCIFRHFTRTEWEKNRAYHLVELETAIGYPCFVKPANLGSSVGISKARNQAELIQAVNFAFQYDRKVIVEENIDAREIEVAVLGNDEPQASVVGEIVSSNEFYDYKAKYVDGKSAMVIPADIPAETAEQVRQLALQAFLAVDGSGLSRVDFFLGKADQKIYINEINTMPGFTPYSMYPLLWQESGKPYAELLDDLIRLAIERHTAKQSIQYSFDVE